MEQPLNTITEMKMSDGTTVAMTLNYWKLYLLKEKKKKIYEKYNEVMLKGMKEELDMTVVLYTAYLCANQEKQCMEYEEFLQKCPENRNIIRTKVGELTTPKKL